MSDIIALLKSYFGDAYLPNVTIADIFDILIIAYVIYSLLLWIKTSRAWTVMKGIIVVAIFLAAAAIFRLETILWIAKNLINVVLLAFIILFQPELRRALDEIGRKNIFKTIFSKDDGNTRKISDKSIEEIVNASIELSNTRTGALVVIENETPLGEYISTGIEVDAIVSAGLLVNIFEKNTPLHDGAVIIRGDRIVAATCYLPMSDDKKISKSLGTRHRAGLGISEVTDSLTVIISEETGAISVAYGGHHYKELDADSLSKQIAKVNSSQQSVVTKIKKKGGQRSENISEG